MPPSPALGRITAPSASTRSAIIASVWNGVAHSRSRSVAARHRRVIDRRGVNLVFLQQTARHLAAQRGVADMDRHDVAVADDARQAGARRARRFRATARSASRSRRPVGAQMPHAGQCRAGDRRRQRRGEDQAAGDRADVIDDPAVAGDVAAEHAEALGQRALDDVDAVRDVVPLRDATALAAVHADGMHLVDIGHGAVTDRRDRRWR